MPRPVRMAALVLAGFAAGLALAIAALAGWRLADDAATARAWRDLAASAPAQPGVFDPTQVDGLPDPARRFFLFAIRPGARLSTVAEITMGGELSLGTRDAPGYQPMQAKQILAAPAGFVWKVRAGSGAMRMSGSDGMAGGSSWTRFRLLGLVPVARAGGDADHLRSSFGRAVAEAMFWAPAALLPRPGAVAWDALDADTARATVTHGELRQQVIVRVDAAGRPLWVSLPRWSNANPDHAWREQPFGGRVADFREVDGFRVPFTVEGGNFFGTDAFFPFYKARVQALRFPAPPAGGMR